MTIPYTENTAWADDAGGGTPITAAKLNNVEQGVTDAQLMPAVHVFHSTVQSVNNVTFTKLSFDSERFDTVGGAASTQHDTVTNNSRLTCLYAGKYHIVGNVAYVANATGQRYGDVLLNNATIITAATTNNLGAGNGVYLVVSTIYALAVNDYVELRGYQDSGGALNTASLTEFMMVRVA